MNTLQVNGLTKTFGAKLLLSNINIAISTNEIIAVFGRNGCGKSTMLKILFGTLKADRLHLTINNNEFDVKDIIPQQKIAYLPQEPFLPKSLKVRDIIPLYYKGDEQDKIFYADGIHKITNTRAGSLSMGELRYFELLLIANLNHPFLMLDEPFSMVEPLYKEKIKSLLLKLRATKGILITDHYYKDVLAVSTKKFVLKDGTLTVVNNEAELAAQGYLPAALNTKS